MNLGRGDGLVRGSARVLAATLMLAAGGLVATSTSRGATPTCVGAELSPFDDSPALGAVMTPAPELVNALAREYCRTTADPSVEDFVLWWGYNRLEDIALGAAPPPPGVDLDLSKDADLKRALWVQHVFGTYTSNWFWHVGHAGEAYGPTAYNPTMSLLGPVIAAVDPDHAKSVAQMRHAMGLANHGADGEVTAYNLKSVRGEPLVPGTGGVGLYAPFLSADSGDAVFFGYDLGELVAVVNVNKPTFAPRQVPYYSYRSDAPLEVTYAIGDAPFLGVSRGRYDAVKRGSAGADAKARLTAAMAGTQPADDVTSVATESLLIGNTLWAAQSNLKDYSEPQYDRALRTSVYTVQYSQSNALAGLAAYATKDTELGRRQIRAIALWKAYAWGYLDSLGSKNARLPTLTPAAAKPAKKPATRCTRQRQVVVRTAGLRGPQVLVNGRRVRVKRGRAVVDLRGRPGRKVVIRITGRDGHGRLRKRIQTLTTCAKAATR